MLEYYLTFIFPTDPDLINVYNIVPQNDHLSSPNLSSIFNTVFLSAAPTGQKQVSVEAYLSDEKWHHNHLPQN